MPIRTLPHLILLATTSLLACSAALAEVGKPPNFLILIGDDMSVETVGCYGVGSSPAKTPQIDQLCDTGMRFDNFWTQPLCSPTRATMLTGQFGFRNGVGTPAGGPIPELIVPEKPASAPPESAREGGRRGRAGGEGPRGPREITPNPNAQRPGYTEPENARPSISIDAYGLPRALAADASLGYQTAAVGKWHLASNENGLTDHPANVGFDHYAGGITAAVESFYAWSKVVDGEITEGDTRYATTATVDDGLSWLSQRDTDKPWLLWVAFNAPHTPQGAPPDSLLSEETAGAIANVDIAEERLPFYLAMIEAMDTEIGRMLEAIEPEELANTYVIFIGDNGTPPEGVTAPFVRGRVKGSVYQGGVNTPFVVTGPGIEGASVSKSLANSVDLYSTILDLAGVGRDPKLDEVTLDAVSLVPTFKDPATQVRSYAYADVFGPQQNVIANRRAIRDDRFKLVLDLQNDTAEFYDLSVDPYEKVDLLQNALNDDAQASYDGLTAKLDALIASK